MPRIFHIPGVIFLLCAFVLLFLVSISLPYLTALDIARVKLSGDSPTVGSDSNAIHQIRFGTCGPQISTLDAILIFMRRANCWYEDSDTRACSTANNVYSTTIYDSQHQDFVTIGPSWTRGVAVHPVATGVTFSALLLSLSTHVTFTLLAFLTTLLTLIAFAIDIALYAFVKHQMGKLDGVSSNTDTAPEFWLTFVSFLLLCFAGCTVCFGRRRDRAEGATTYNYSWKDRFRRTPRY